MTKLTKTWGHVINSFLAYLCYAHRKRAKYCKYVSSLPWNLEKLNCFSKYMKLLTFTHDTHFRIAPAFVEGSVIPDVSGSQWMCQLMSSCVNSYLKSIVGSYIHICVRVIVAGSVNTGYSTHITIPYRSCARIVQKTVISFSTTNHIYGIIVYLIVKPVWDCVKIWTLSICVNINEITSWPNFYSYYN